MRSAADLGTAGRTCRRLLTRFRRRPGSVTMREMKQTLFFSIVILAVVALAVGGWTIKGVRRALPPKRRLALA